MCFNFNKSYNKTKIYLSIRCAGGAVAGPLPVAAWPLTANGQRADDATRIAGAR